MKKEIDIEIIMELLSSSIGVDAAEGFIYEAVDGALLQRKKYYSEDEFKKICENLKKKGEHVAIFVDILLTSEYRERYYEMLSNKEKEEKEKVLGWYKELQHTHEELKQLHQQIIQSEKLAAVGKMASVISHELRNPLAVMKNIEYLLKITMAGNTQVADFLRMLDEEINFIDKIISELLDFSKTRQISKVPIKIVLLIDEIIDSLLLSKVINEERIKIVKYYNFDCEIIIDPHKIKQVIQNIINNAVQSMPDGGTLTITTEGQVKVKSEAGKENGVLVISISDTGCGIKKENVQHIFEPFYTTKIKGTGLGLAIVKDIIEAHNGEITIESEEGKGTCFKIMLPTNSSEQGVVGR